jgi:site-specific DNA-methyltransferase (adenine-specific)
MNVIENFSKGGFVGQIQPNSLIHADCLEAMKYIEPKSIDMILCDLPYGTTACKWDVVIPFEPLWEQYKRIIKDNGAIVLFGSQPFTSALVMSNPKMFRYCGYWIKDKPSNFLMGRKQPLRYVEEWIVFYKKQCTYNPIMELREQKNKRKNKLTSSLLKNEIIGINEKTEKYQERLLSGTKDYIYPRNYQFFTNRTKGLHPTQKPVALCEYLIKTYTNEGETVLDNCAGSGSTGIACINTNRNFIGIEKDDTYFEVAKKRINEQVLTLF